MLFRKLLPAFAIGYLVWSTQLFAQDELPDPLQTDEAKASYGIGLDIGQNFQRGGFDVQTFDFEAFVQGMRDALEQQEPKISPAEFAKSMGAVQQLARSRYEQRMKPIIEKNQKDGAAFLEKFKKLKGAESLPSGLLYQVIKRGNGTQPTKTDFVKVHYRGRLTDGKEFDSTYGAEPAVFAVGEVIPGWTEALQQMNVGSKWRIAVPSKLGYGEMGNPPAITPQAVLMFDIELLGIEQPPTGLLPQQ